MQPTTFRSSRMLTAALAAVLALASQAASGHGSATPEQSFQLALEAQTARNYHRMQALLRQAAVHGHTEAQVTLGMVLLAGQTLYGPAVRRDRCEAVEWFRKAAQAGHEAGRFQLEFVNRLRFAPAGVDTCGHALRN